MPGFSSVRNPSLTHTTIREFPPERRCRDSATISKFVNAFCVRIIILDGFDQHRAPTFGPVAEGAARTRLGLAVGNTDPLSGRFPRRPLAYRSCSRAVHRACGLRSVGTPSGFCDRCHRCPKGCGSGSPPNRRSREADLDVIDENLNLALFRADLEPLYWFPGRMAACTIGPIRGSSG